MCVYQWLKRLLTRAANMQTTATAQKEVVSAPVISTEGEMFANHDWTQCEPTYNQVLAASYLEAKGYIFGQHFDCKNVEECAESVYLAEISMEQK